MNYIKHLNAFLKRATTEPWVTANHYALYMTLFHWWNRTGFQKVIPIKRGDLIKASRVKSKTTYYRCLKELAEAKLLIYYPSKSRFITAEMELLPLVNETLQVPEEGLNKQTNKNYAKSKSNGPSLDDVLKLFIAHQCNTEEGVKFWYQYEATDWMLGINPIVNWEALAHKWILRVNHFNPSSNVSNDQDYDEPF